MSDAPVPGRGDEEIKVCHVYPDEPHARRTTVLVVAAFSALFIILVLGLTAVSSGTISREEGPAFVPVGWLTAGVTVVATAIIIPLVYLGRAMIWSQRLRRVQARRPNSVAFLARRTPQLSDALDSSALIRARLPRQFVVTVDRTSGLELWSGRSPQPKATANLSDTDAFEVGYLSVLHSRVKLPTRTLFVLGERAGHQLRFPLPPLGDRGIAFASARDSNLLVDRLSQFLRLN